MSPVIQGRVLGGSTVVNSAIMWRLPEDVWAGWDREFGLGRDLPLEQLHQRWDLIERELSVAPTPQEVWGENNRLLGIGGRALGVRTAPMRRAVAACRGSARCQSGCPFGAKQSMALTYLPYAEGRGAVLLTGARAHQAVMRGDRAEGVEGTFATGSPFVLRAGKAVIVAASAIQTPGLLQRSGVRSSHLGRHFQAHPGTAMVGVFDQPRLIRTDEAIGKPMDAGEDLAGARGEEQIGDESETPLEVRHVPSLGYEADHGAPAAVPNRSLGVSPEVDGPRRHVAGSGHLPDPSPSHAR